MMLKFFLHLLIGPLILALGLFFKFSPPKEINGVYGYRTATSMKSQEAWDEANRYSANLMVLVGVATIVVQILASFFMRFEYVLMIACGFMVLCLIGTIPITENHLKKHFPEGERRKSEN